MPTSPLRAREGEAGSAPPPPGQSLSWELSETMLHFPRASVILQKGHRAASRPWVSKEGRHRFRKKMLSLSYKNRLKSHKQ